MDMRDPEARERFEWEAPDAYMGRREFLARMAALAGLSTGLSTVLHPDTLVAAAASAQERQWLPSPRNLPIDTFVVLMMENRSFDHYLGWLPGADGMQTGLSYRDSAGVSHPTHALGADLQGCAFNDPDHSWEGGRTELDGGACDGWLRAGMNDAFSIGFYAKDLAGPLKFIQTAAQTFTTFDRFFCSLLGPTFPNREYMHAAQSYAQITNTRPDQAGYRNGFPDATIFAAAKAAGKSVGYFFNDLPVSALWGSSGLQRSMDIQSYHEMAAAGTLPAVTYVDPAFEDEGSGTSGDEHPHGDVSVGQAFMADIVKSFMDSSQYARGAMFIVYDEWGGFFDHVAPPRVRDLRNHHDINKDFGQMGFRIPALVISPYARRGHVSHTVFGFESILKMIEYRFGLDPLTRRDQHANNIALAFDWESPPRLSAKPFEDSGLPAPDEVVANRDHGAPCPPTAPGATAVAHQAGQRAKRQKPHDMHELLASGYLDRLGFHYRPATPWTTWREPHKMMQKIQGRP